MSDQGDPPTKEGPKPLSEDQVSSSTNFTPVLDSDGKAAD